MTGVLPATDTESVVDDQMLPFGLLGLAMLTLATNDILKNRELGITKAWLSGSQESQLPFDRCVYFLQHILSGMGRGDLDREWLRKTILDQPGDAMLVLRRIKSGIGGTDYYYKPRL